MGLSGRRSSGSDFPAQPDGERSRHPWEAIQAALCFNQHGTCSFLLTFTFVAFAQGTDIIESIDPFRIYKPSSLGIGAGAFIAAILIASLFTYRPWCHFFCPFGLVGWLVEKISLVKISVNYETCIACGKCADACPSTVMGAILRRNKKTIPDCFACYTCRDICPTGSVSFSSRKRTLPSPGHFHKRCRAETVENE
jgi:polyferredoxin